MSGYPKGIHGNCSEGRPIEICQNADGTIDEIVMRGVGVHIEQMTADNWFVGVDAADGYWQFWI